MPDVFHGQAAAISDTEGVRFDDIDRQVNFWNSHRKVPQLNLKIL
jgi:hypothetical protein